ncbi:MAG: hypothetical protein HY549_03030 [Elusimicrobia bacterium]|nr:hypothetical protein [Elusimicrobiota bacterium]
MSLVERFRNTWGGLTPDQKRLMVLAAALFASAVCLWSSWSVIDAMRKLEAEKPFVLGNFPGLVKEPRWQAALWWGRIIRPFAFGLGALGVIGLICSPIVYWFYRDSR